MSDRETDPFALSDAREREVDRLEERSHELEGEVKRTREEWERKRADDSVPGAPPRDEPEQEAEPESPAPQAPPPSAGPGDAQTPPEGAAGWPADAIDGDDG